MPENVAQVHEIIHEDHRQKKYPSCMQHYGTVIQDMPAHFVGWIQHEADCCKVRATKQHRTEVSMEHREQVSIDPALLPQVVTGDESWTNGYNPATKQQSSQQKCPSSSWLKKVQRVKSNVKSMLICFSNN